MNLAHAPRHCARCEELAAEVLWLKEQLAPNVREDQLDALRKVGLSPNASYLLFALSARAGKAVTRARLNDALAPPLDHAKERDGWAVVDVYICRIRKRFGYAAIETVWGVGYRLTDIGAAKLREALGALAPVDGPVIAPGRRGAP